MIKKATNIRVLTRKEKKNIKKQIIAKIKTNYMKNGSEARRPITPAQLSNKNKIKIKSVINRKERLQANVEQRFSR